MHIVIGLVVGLLLNHFVIKPWERKRIRRELIRYGKVPPEMELQEGQRQ